MDFPFLGVGWGGGECWNFVLLANFDSTIQYYQAVVIIKSSDLFLLTLNVFAKSLRRKEKWNTQIGEFEKGLESMAYLQKGRQNFVKARNDGVMSWGYWQWEVIPIPKPGELKGLCWFLEPRGREGARERGKEEGGGRGGRWSRGGADEDGEGEERAVGKGPCSGAAFGRELSLCSGCLGRSEWISIAPQPHPSHPPDLFFFSDFLLVPFLAKLSQKIEDREPKDAVQWSSSRGLGRGAQQMV